MRLHDSAARSAGPTHAWFPPRVVRAVDAISKNLASSTHFT
jgi:hypothetical protein